MDAVYALNQRSFVVRATLFEEFMFFCSVYLLCFLEGFQISYYFSSLQSLSNSLILSSPLL